MRTTIILFILIVVSLTSCSDRQEKSESSIPTKIVDTFPTSFIRQVSIERLTHYNLDSLDLSKLNVVDTTFFKKWFDNISVNNLDFVIQFDRYSRYYFLDHIDLDKKFLFSIVQNDEIGYDLLFHFTYDKEKDKFVQVDFIASTGGDGGHSNLDILNYNKRGDALLMTSISIFDEDIDGGYTRQYDSTITRIEFNLPTTKYLTVDSLSKLDTIFSTK